MAKKKLTEANITGFINKFLDSLQQDTVDRFVKQAEKKGVPKPVTTKLAKIEKQVKEIEDFLKDIGEE